MRAVKAAMALVAATWIMPSAVGGISDAQAAESQSIDIQIRKLSDNLAAQYKELFAKEWRYQRIAVLPFEASGEAEEKGIGRVVAAELNTLLVRDHGFNVVERAQLTKVLEEQALAQTGALGPEAAEKVSELLDVQALVVGDVGEAGDKFLINARVVSSEKANVLAAESISLDRAGLVSFSAQSVVLRTRVGALARSTLIPGWGQYYNRQRFKAGVMLGLVVLTGGLALGFHLDGSNNEDRYNNLTEDNLQGRPRTDCGPDLLPASCTAQFLKDEAEADYRMRNIFLIAMGGVWLYNAVDAYFSGVDAEEEAGLVMGPTPVITPEGGGGLGFAISF